MNTSSVQILGDAIKNASLFFLLIFTFIFILAYASKNK